MEYRYPNAEIINLRIGSDQEIEKYTKYITGCIEEIFARGDQAKIGDTAINSKIRDTQIEREVRNILRSALGRGDSTQDPTVIHCENLFNSIPIKRADMEDSFMRSKVIAYLVPDEILFVTSTMGSVVKHEFVGVLMNIHISGLTSLCEKCMNTGRGGTLKLTKILNEFIGALFEIIYSWGGDVLKFYDGSILTVWKVDRVELLMGTIHEVIKCAFIIQSNLGFYVTDVKITLNAKVAIGAGKVTVAIIGDLKCADFITYGKCLKDVFMADRLSTFGDIILSPFTWDYCIPRIYNFVILPQKFVHIKQVLNDAKFPGLNATTIKKNIFTKTNRKASSNTSIENYSSDYSHDVKNDGDTDQKRYAPVRNFINENMSVEFLHSLRKFILTPVLQQLDSKHSLDYITEMHQITAMCINIRPNEHEIRDYITFVDEIYKEMNSYIQKAWGCIHNISVIDQEIICSVVFGLKGYQHEFEARNALCAARYIYDYLKENMNINCISIGVATGIAYCGMVGHSLRTEHVVLGNVINKANKFSYHYTKKIICCQTTFRLSNLPQKRFILQVHTLPNDEFNMGNIYEYSEENRWYTSTSNEIPILLPLLGRDKEITEFLRTISSYSSATTSNPSEFSGILIHGEQRIGKSRFLDQCVTEASRLRFKISATYLTFLDANVPYSAIRKIFAQLLDLDPYCNEKEYQSALYHSIHMNVDPNDMCFLNDIFQVKFAKPHGYYFKSDSFKESQKTKLFSALMEAIGPNTFIAIDNIQYLDPLSCHLITLMMDWDLCFVAMCVYRDKLNQINTDVFELMIHKKMRKIFLSGLPDVIVGRLACQFLNVNAIPRQLEEQLIQVSHGNPGMVESYLVELEETKNLQLYNVPLKKFNNEAKLMNLVVPKGSNSKRLALYASDQDELDKIYDESKKIKVCRLYNSYQDLSSQRRNQEIGFLTRLYDRLQPYDQLVIKAAAVLGFNFTRAMMEHLMEQNSLALPKSIQKFFDYRIFECDTNVVPSTTQKPQNFSLTSVRSFFANVTPNIVCFCTDNIHDINDSLPKYAYCKHIRFRHDHYRKYIYSLISNEQRAEFHRNAITYLEHLANKCSSCGGGSFEKKILEQNHSLKQSSSDDFLSILRFENQHSNIKFSSKSEERLNMINLESNEKSNISVLLEGQIKNSVKSYQSKSRSAEELNSPLNYSFEQKATTVLSQTQLSSKKELESLNLNLCDVEVHTEANNEEEDVYNLINPQQAASYVVSQSQNQLDLAFAGDRFPTLNSSKYVTIDSEGLQQFRENLEEKMDYPTPPSNRLEEKLEIALPEETRESEDSEANSKEEDCTEISKDCTVKSEAFDKSDCENGKPKTVNVKQSSSTFIINVKPKQSSNIEKNSSKSHLPSNTVQKQISFMRTNVFIDFRNCTCSQIVSGVYQQLIWHCEMANVREKLIQYLIEFASACIFLGKNLYAIEALKKAETLCNSLLHNRATWLKKAFMGKIYVCFGEALLEQGKLAKAKDHFAIALKYFGKSLSNGSITLPYSIAIQKKIQKCHQLFPKLFATKSYKNCVVSANIAKAFMLLTKIHILEDNWHLSKFTALKSLNLAQITDVSKNLDLLCDSYSILMNVCNRFGDHGYCILLETSASHEVKRFYVEHNIEHLVAIVRLFDATLQSRILRGSLTAAIRVGFKILDMNKRLYELNMNLTVIPHLSLALMYTKRITEVADLLQMLKFVGKQENNLHAFLWYYVICLEMIIDGGITVEHYENIRSFAEVYFNLTDDSEFKNFKYMSKDAVKTTEVESRLALNMLIFNLRNRLWNNAEVWLNLVHNHVDKEMDPMEKVETIKKIHPVNLLLELKRIESLMLILKHKLDDCEEQSSIKATRDLIEKYLKVLGKRIPIVAHHILPRFLHLKAYYALLTKNKNRAIDILDSANKAALAQNNHLEIAWISRSREVWKGVKGVYHNNFWEEHCGLSRIMDKDAEFVDWHDAIRIVEVDWANLLYTLNIPKN